MENTFNRSMRQNRDSSAGGTVDYKGTWDANTNTPDLPSSSPSKGDYYIISVAGTTSLGGITDWAIGDWAIYNGTVWQKVDNTDLVTSVFTRTGAVTAQAGDYSYDQVTGAAGKIESNITYYVDGTAGNDGNDGSDWANAKATLTAMLNSLPKLIINQAIVTINCRNTITETTRIRIRGFQGDGSIKIVGTTSDVDTGIAVTGQDNTASSTTYHTYLDASAEAWTPDEHKGRFIVVTGGTGSGSTLYPIVANSATRLETVDLPNLDGTSVVKIVSGNVITSTVGMTWDYNDIVIEMENFDCDGVSTTFSYFEYNAARMLIKNCRFKVVGLLYTALRIENCYFNATGFLYNYADDFSKINPISSVFDSTDTNGYGVYVSKQSTCTVFDCRFEDNYTGCYSDNQEAEMNISGDNFFVNCGIGIQGNSCLINLNKFDAKYCNFVGGTVGLDPRGSTVMKSKTSTLQGNPATEVILDTTGRTTTFAAVNGETTITNLAVGTEFIYFDIATFELDFPSEYSNTINSVAVKTFKDAIDEVATNGAFLNSANSFTDNLTLTNTTNSNQKGIIYKSSNLFLHNFEYGDNGTVTPFGKNLFCGEASGNLTVGATATTTTQSSRNNGYGYNTLSSLTTGYENNAFGSGALEDLTTGFGNVAVGDQCLTNLQTGTRNIAVGQDSQTSSTNGTNNVSVGSFTIASLTSGNQNSTLGNESLRYITAVANNCGMGYRAGTYYTGGSPNTNTSGADSIFIGAFTEAKTASDSNQIVIGYQNVGLGDNSCVIGNSSQTLCSIRGDLTLGGDTASARLDVTVADTVNKNAVEINQNDDTNDKDALVINNTTSAGKSIVVNTNEFVVDSTGYAGIGVAAPATSLEIFEDDTLTGNVTDSYTGAITLDPGYTVTDAGSHTVTRHNYIDVNNPSETETSGTITITDAAVMRFDAAAGTHKAIDSGDTKSTPSSVDAYLKFNINGTIYYALLYTSKTA